MAKLYYNQSYFYLEYEREGTKRRSVVEGLFALERYMKGESMPYGLLNDFIRLFRVDGGVIRDFIKEFDEIEKIQTFAPNINRRLRESECYSDTVDRFLKLKK